MSPLGISRINFLTSRSPSGGAGGPDPGIGLGQRGQDHHFEEDVRWRYHPHHAHTRRQFVDVSDPPHLSLFVYFVDSISFWAMMLPSRLQYQEFGPGQLQAETWPFTWVDVSGWWEGYLKILLQQRPAKCHLTMVLRQARWYPQATLNRG